MATMDHKISINYDLAGRSDHAHDFQDLRSADRARKRIRRDREKYFSYKAVNRGQTGRPHYALHEHFHGKIFVCGLPQDCSVQEMTKQELYKEAQGYPRPPANHVSVIKRYPEWPKTARYEKLYKARKWRDHQLREDAEQARSREFAFFVRGDFAELDFFNRKSTQVVLQHPDGLESHATDILVETQPLDSGILSGGPQHEDAIMLGRHLAFPAEDLTDSWVESNGDVLVTTNSCFWTGCPGWFDFSEDRDGAWCNLCSTHHEDRACFELCREPRLLALGDCLPDCPENEALTPVVQGYGDSPAVEQDLAAYDDFDPVPDDYYVVMPTLASKSSNTDLENEWSLTYSDMSDRNDVLDTQVNAEDEDWSLIDISL